MGKRKLKQIEFSKTQNKPVLQIQKGGLKNF
jgi:hypothetical protein